MSTIAVLKEDTIKRNAQSLAKWRVRAEPKVFELDGIKITVGANVFPPKVDSLLLVKEAKIPKNSIVLDTCAGSGIQAVYLAKIKKAKKVYSCDISEYAIQAITMNVKENGVADRVIVIKCDLFPNTSIKYDAIFANPPYLDHEALDILEQSVWDKGNTVLRRLLKESDKYLKPSGKLFLSWANFADFSLFEFLARECGWTYKVIATGGNDLIFNATIDSRMESRIYELSK